MPNGRVGGVKNAMITTSSEWVFSKDTPIASKLIQFTIKLQRIIRICGRYTGPGPRTAPLAESEEATGTGAD